MHPRHSVILELVNDRGRITVAELSSLVGVSEVTIRQDLTFLETQGFLKRIHGAATILDSDDPEHRIWAHSKTKIKLAELAASMVETGESVLIEGGSANVMLAKLLGKRGDVTIITPSAYIAHQLRQSHNDVILLGGLYQGSSESLVGPLTRLCIEHVHFSKAFIGIDGFHVETGFTNRNMMRADVANSVLAKRQENIILSDSSKFGCVYAGAIGPANLISRVITDHKVTPQDAEWIQLHGIDLLSVN